MDSKNKVESKNDQSSLLKELTDIKAKFSKYKEYNKEEEDENLRKDIEEEMKKPVVLKKQGLTLNGKLIIDATPELENIRSEEEKISFLLKNPIFLLNDLRINKIDNLHIYKDNLKELYLQRNMISKIENLDYLDNLEVLSLGDNYIKKLENLTHLRKLEILDISDNLIEVLEPSQLPGNLSFIYLYDNGFFETMNEFAIRFACISWLKNLIKIDGLEVNYRERFICSGKKINPKYSGKGECKYIEDFYNNKREKRRMIKIRREMLDRQFDEVDEKKERKKTIDHQEVEVKAKKIGNEKAEIKTDFQAIASEYEDKFIDNISHLEDANQEINRSHSLKTTANDVIKSEQVDPEKFTSEIDKKKEEMKRKILERSNDFLKTSEGRMSGLLSTLSSLKEKVGNFSKITEDGLLAMRDKVRESTKYDDFMSKIDAKISNYDNYIMETIHEQEERSKVDYSMRKSVVASAKSKNQLLDDSKSRISEYKEYKDSESNVSEIVKNVMKDLDYDELHGSLAEMKRFADSFTKNDKEQWELKNPNLLKEFADSLSNSRNDTSKNDISRLEEDLAPKANQRKQSKDNKE